MHLVSPNQYGRICRCAKSDRRKCRLYRAQPSRWASRPLSAPQCVFQEYLDICHSHYTPRSSSRWSFHLLTQLHALQSSRNGTKLPPLSLRFEIGASANDKRCHHHVFEEHCTNMTKLKAKDAISLFSWQ